MANETVGSADFVIRLRDAITRPMDQLMQKMRASVSGLSGVLSIAGGNLLAAGIQKAAASVQGFVSQGLAANAQFDKLNNSFTSMLKSQTKATALMKGLTAFAAKTPFELPDLSQAAASLLATRQVGERDVIPMLQKLGDAAAGSTEGFAAMPRVIRAISQMLSKGKLQTEEMLQLAEAGIPAWGALAKAMGKSTAEVQAMASKGKLGIKEIMLLVDGLGAEYAGLAEKQSKTFEGMASTLRDNFNMALAQVTRPIYDRMTAVMASIAELMNSKQFQKAIDAITARIAGAIKWLDKMVDQVIAFAASPLGKQVAQFAAIAASVVAIGAGLAWIPSLAAMGAALAPTVAVIAAISAGVAGLARLIQNAMNSPAGEQFRAKLAEIWKLLKEIGGNVGAAVYSVVQRIGAAISSAFGDSGSLQSGFTAFLGSVLSGLQGILNYTAIFTSDFAASWEFIKTSAAAGISGIADRIAWLFTSEIPNYVQAFTAAMFEAIDQIIAGFWKIAPEAVSSSADIFKAYAKMSGDVLTANAGMVNETSQLFATLAKNIKTIFTSAMEFTASLFTKFVDMFVSRFEKISGAIDALVHGDSRTAFNLFRDATSSGKMGVDFAKFAQDEGRKFGEKNPELVKNIEERVAAIAGKAQESIDARVRFARDGVGKEVARIAAIGAEHAAQAWDRISLIFDAARNDAAPFQESAQTTALRTAAESLWNRMTGARQQNEDARGKRDIFNNFMRTFQVDKIAGFLKGIDPAKVPGQVGGALAGIQNRVLDMFFGGGAAAAAAPNAKSKAKAEFVGIAEMNKRIQGMLGGDDDKKIQKQQLAAQKQGAAAAKQGAAVGQQVANSVKALLGAVKDLNLGFGT